MLDKCSIITDFGCKTGCEYCIWKKHSLYDEKHEKFMSSIFNEHYWEKIKFLFRNSKKVDITGGGDPFCNFKSNVSKLFYDRLTREIESSNVMISVHTSIITNIFGFMDQYVWHAPSFSSFCSAKMQDSLMKIEGKDWLKIKKRVVVVVDEEFLKDVCSYKDQFISSMNIYTINNIQISFRQAIDGYDHKGNAQITKVRIPGYEDWPSSDWNVIKGSLYDVILHKDRMELVNNTYFISQGDYSALYLMPDGELYDKYLF